MFAFLVLIIFAITGMTLPSQGEAYTSDGHDYEMSCNASGYVLKSKYPVTRTVGFGAGTQYISKRENLFLGKSCDAYHEIYGYGEWCWANGGFFASFTEHKFEFWRQELYCPERNDAFDLNCNCR